MRAGSRFDKATQLIGRVDRGEESFAVQIGDDGKVDVYHWPGFGKHKKLKFSGALIPLNQAGKAVPATAPPKAEPQALLFSRSHTEA